MFLIIILLQRLPKTLQGIACTLNLAKLIKSDSANGPASSAAQDDNSPKSEKPNTVSKERARNQCFRLNLEDTQQKSEHEKFYS